MKLGALPGLRFHGDRAAVRVDDRIGDGEAEPRSEFLGREVGVEDAIELVRRDAVSLVLHREADVAARREPGHRERRVFRQFLVRQRDVHDAASRHRLERVEHQVVHHLADLIEVHVGCPEIVVDA